MTPPAIAGALRTVTLADRPELVEAIGGLLASRWPTFMLDGRPGHDVDVTRFAVEAPGHQVLLLDADDQLLGFGASVPLGWDGTVAGLPAGWDGAVTAAADLLDRVGDGTSANTVCALSITLAPGATGGGLAGRMLEAIKAAAAGIGATTVIVPVRPVLKTRHPRTPMAEFLTWRTDDGRDFDPWLRLHRAAGGEVLGIADPSMTVTGSIADWQRWTELPLSGSGEHLIPGGLSPLVIDRQAGTGVYREANVWVAHPVAV